jgi:hypothetical protein
MALLVGSQASLAAWTTWCESREGCTLNRTQVAPIGISATANSNVGRAGRLIWSAFHRQTICRRSTRKPQKNAKRPSHNEIRRQSETDELSREEVCRQIARFRDSSNAFCWSDLPWFVQVANSIRKGCRLFRRGLQLPWASPSAGARHGLHQTCGEGRCPRRLRAVQRPWKPVPTPLDVLSCLP